MQFANVTLDARDWLRVYDGSLNDNRILLDFTKAMLTQQGPPTAYVASQSTLTVLLRTATTSKETPGFTMVYKVRYSGACADDEVMTSTSVRSDAPIWSLPPTMAS